MDFSLLNKNSEMTVEHGQNYDTYEMFYREYLWLDQFDRQLEQAVSWKQKQSAIEQVFIPNTLDDMKRFFVYVTSQYNEQTEPQIKMAWKQKVKKCYKVSSILFDTDKDFGKLQETYILAQNHILEVDEILERRTKVSRIVYLAPTFVGMIFWLIHFCSNVFGENSIQFEICAILATLAGSFFFDKSDHFMVTTLVACNSILCLLGLSAPWLFSKNIDWVMVIVSLMIFVYYGFQYFAPKQKKIHRSIQKILTK